LLFVAACTTARPPPSALQRDVDPGHEEVPRPEASPPDAAEVPWSPGGALDGPHEALKLGRDRSIWYAARPGGPYRLVAHLHGMCGPPSYACGKWIFAGTDAGALVCPTGNARCGDPNVGPPSWEAPSWPELVRAMDQDLEIAITKVKAKLPL